jgi:hypothetical protein
MAAPYAFRDTWYTIAPEWLTTGTAEEYIYTLQLCSDAMVDTLQQGALLRFPGLGDVSQVPYLAHDRQLTQGPNESSAAFLARITQAFNAWGGAGSRVSVLQQLGYYLQGTQTGVPTGNPWMAIVGGSYPTIATWDTVRIGDALGSAPSHYNVAPSNMNWDGSSKPWRVWLILYQALVAIAGLSGSSAATGVTTASACYSTTPGVMGSGATAGVWIPATSGTPFNSPWLTLTGLSGLTAAQVGHWITMSGSVHAGNNGTFPIVQVLSATSCIIANPSNIALDPGPIAWSIAAYPWIGPGMPWGSSGMVLGQGELVTPPLDTGTRLGGVWQSTTPPSANQVTSSSWGLSCPSTTIDAVRTIVQAWKSAGSWYHDIVVAFDGGTGTVGTSWSPYSSVSPAGDRASPGSLVSGVWLPVGQLAGTLSAWDAYCRGTGSYSACSVPNVT